MSTTIDIILAPLTITEIRHFYNIRGELPPKVLGPTKENSQSKDLHNTLTLTD
jgi:hypothetical protein